MLRLAEIVDCKSDYKYSLMLVQRCELTAGLNEIAQKRRREGIFTELATLHVSPVLSWGYEPTAQH